MGGEGAFLQDHALQPPLVIFQQFGRAEIAGDQDRVATQTLACRRAHLARNDAEQPVGEILQIVHPVGQQRIVDLPHPHPGALLDALNRGFRRQAGINRLDDPAAPPFVVSDHLVGLEHFLMLTPQAEFGLTGHPVNLFAHLVKGEVDALQFGIAVLGHDVFDGDPRLVIDRRAHGQALDQGQAGQAHRPGLLRAQRRLLVIDQARVRNQFGQDHGDRLQRLDLHLFIPARLVMLNAEHAHRPFAPHDRYAGEGMVLFLPRFRAVRKVRVGRRFGQVQSFDVFGNRADQAFAHAHAGDVDRLLRQPLGGEEFQHPFAQQVDRANLAIQPFADHFDHGVQLGLRMAARSHHVVQTGQDRAGGGNGAGHWHEGERRPNLAVCKRSLSSLDTNLYFALV